MVAKVVKVNFTTSPEVKAWYKEEAENLGLTMSGLMSFVLAQYKKNEESRQVLSELNQANKNMDMSFIEDMKAIVNAIKEDAEMNSYEDIKDMLTNREDSVVK